MEPRFKKGDKVIVTSKSTCVQGVIKDVYTNFCTFKDEYSIDYKKNGKTWTMICIPENAITKII